ncbi:YbaY family lipoprotein [Pseudomonas sp. RT6P73]
MSNEYEKSISGMVHYLHKIFLPQNSTLYVNLLDISAADGSTKELAKQVISDAETKALDFTLTYKMADVLPGHRYAIRARIETTEQMIYKTIKLHAVELGVDHLRPEDVVVRSVREAPEGNI